MLQLNFVLLTKCYDPYDFKYWFEYHSKRFPSARFIVFDNDSPVDIRSAVDPEKYRYFRICGFPNQKQLYGDIMNKQYGELFKDGDAVCFIDDDEFLYCHDPNAGEHEIHLEKVLSRGLEQYDTLVLPHINMSEPELPKDRKTYLGMPNTGHYHRSDESATVKCFVRYRSDKKYAWGIQTGVDEAGHVPFVNGERKAAVFTAWFDKEVGCSKGLFFPIGNTSFAQIDYDSNVRLYHYHLKSRWDWDQKIKRGSCAGVIPWYSEKVEENCFWGDYTVKDESMALEFNRLVKIEHPWPGEMCHDDWTPIVENWTTIRRGIIQSRKPRELDELAKVKVDYETIRFSDDKIGEGVRWIHQNCPDVDIYNPKNIVDRINFNKLWDCNPAKILWADKIGVYKELYELGLENTRIPVIYERYKPSRAEIEHAISLCEGSDMILKCNHGSGWNIRFTPQDGVNYDYLIEKIEKWLSLNYAYIAGYEWHYEPIVPGILVQPALFPASVHPTDYQFWCENGEVVAVELQRKISKVIIEHIAWTDTDGNPLDWYIGSKPLQRGLNKSQLQAVKTMLPVVGRIAKQFKFVRVDLFWVNERVYFCEATFCPCSGVLDLTINTKTC